MVPANVWATAALQLATRLAYDGGWNRIPQPWDVIELFSTDAHVSFGSFASWRTSNSAL